MWPSASGEGRKAGSSGKPLLPSVFALEANRKPLTTKQVAERRADLAQVHALTARLNSAKKIQKARIAWEGHGFQPCRKYLQFDNTARLKVVPFPTPVILGNA